MVGSSFRRRRIKPRSHNPSNQFAVTLLAVGFALAGFAKAITLAALVRYSLAWGLQSTASRVASTGLSHGLWPLFVTFGMLVPWIVPGTMAAIAVGTARNLAKRRHRRFCLAAAVVFVLLGGAPGLLLGAATILVLTGRAARERFALGVAATPWKSPPEPKRAAPLPIPDLRGAHLIALMAGLTGGALLARLVQQPLVALALFIAALAGSVRSARRSDDARMELSAFGLWFVLAGYLVVWQQLRMEQ